VRLPRRRPETAGAVRVRAVVAGRVQGVWFRESCRREADRLGVTGWVTNRADGRVEIEAEGDRAAVDALVAWAHRGPPRATVERVTVEPRAPDGSSGFVVR
jgi:acylphosphatase